MIEGSSSDFATFIQEVHTEEFALARRLAPSSDVALHRNASANCPPATHHQNREQVQQWNKRFTYITNYNCQLVKNELISGLFVNHFQPYPGTKTYSKSEFDYSLFDRKTPIVEYPNLTKKDLTYMYNSFKDLINSNFVNNF